MELTRLANHLQGMRTKTTHFTATPHTWTITRVERRPTCVMISLVDEVRMPLLDAFKFYAETYRHDDKDGTQIMFQAPCGEGVYTHILTVRREVVTSWEQ